MISLRFRVILLLYIYTTQIHIGDAISGSVQNNMAPNNTSPIVRPSTILLVNSSGYHHSQLNQISTRVRTPDGNSVHPSVSHASTYLPRSVSFDEITQSTIALAYSVPVSRSFSSVAPKISSASKDRNFTQETETLRTNSAFVVSEKSLRDSGVNSDATTTSERETQSSHVVANITRSYNHLSAKTYSSASFTQITNTVNIIQTTSGVQTKTSRTSHTEGNHLSSSFNPGNSDTYPNRTNVLHRKSFLSSAQTSRNYQRITTLMSSEAFRSSENSALYSKTRDYSSNTTLLPRSQTSNFYQRITPATSGNVSYLSKSEQPTLCLTNILSKSQVHPFQTLATLQNISLTTEMMVTRSSDILTIVSQNTQYVLSMMKTSSQSIVEGLRTQMSERYYSSQGSDDRNSEKTRSTSHFIVLTHSLEQTQKSAMTVTMSAVKYLPSDSEGSSDIPLYVLAICLPVGILLGFCLAFVYIKRSKKEQRTLRYSVTVEVTSEDPDYTMKRMYSIIDINDGNINKDLYPCSKSDTCSSSIEFELTSSETTLQSECKAAEVTDFSS